MSSIGHMFKLFSYDMGLLRPVLLVLLALGAMWLGYRFSRPADGQLSIRRPPLAPGVYAKRRCPECTGPNDFLEWRQSIALEAERFGDFVPPANHYAHYFRCRRCGYDLRLETTSPHPDS